MRTTMKATKKRQAALGLPVQPVRYFGSERAAQIAMNQPTPRRRESLPMVNRLHSKLMYMTQSLPARSPTPMYPWHLPSTPEKALDDEKIPRVNWKERLQNDFAQKVLTMVPGRKA